jgi:arginyl-tRNA synthetase
VAMVKQEISKQLMAALDALGIKDIAPQVEEPADASRGDYSTNVALIAAKKLGKSPREVAGELQLKIDLACRQAGNLKLKILDKVEVAGPGFINFWISREELLQSIEQVEEEKIITNVGSGMPVVVEYSSPNIAKPFTIGHLRSTIIGDAVANLLEATGWKVFRDNHVGDWGTQFGKQIYAIKAWGDEERIARSERPVKELVDLYVKFHEEAEKDPSLEDKAREWFKRLEDGDEEAKRLWQKCIDWSWKEFDAIYKQLGVSFTENSGRGYGESFFENKMNEVINELKEKKLLETGKEGAQIVAFDEQTNLPPLMILKKDGASLYATRDLATDNFRLEKYGKDVTIINEVGGEQELYFRQLIALEQMLRWIKPGQKVHIKHGLYRFKDGKMSTRKGNVIWLEEVLEEAKRRAKALQKVDSDSSFPSNPSNPSLPAVVAIGAIKWNDLKRDSKQDITFDWDDILNMDGNSGPYIQYVYARTQSVLRKAKSEGQKAKSSIRNSNHMSYAFSSMLKTEELFLLRMLYKFNDIVASAAEKYSPNILCMYLFELAQQFNIFYQKHSILKAEGDIKEFRLALTTATGHTIKTGLNLLGIQAPEQM